MLLSGIGLLILGEEQLIVGDVILSESVENIKNREFSQTQPPDPDHQTQVLSFVLFV